jgi:hypothetical protein
VKASLDDHRAEGQFHLRVVGTSPPPPAPEPSLVIEPPRELNVPQGQTVKCDVTVRRDRYDGPVEVRLEEVPAQVECRAVAVPGDQETARLEVTAAADAPESEKEVRVVALAGKLRAEKKLVLKVRTKAFIELTPVEDVVVRAGQKVSLRLGVKRHACEGEVELRLEELPEQVLANKQATIRAQEAETEIVLTALPGALADTKKVRVTARLGELTAETMVTLTVEGAPAGGLRHVPRGLLPRPRVKRGWGEEQATGPADTYPRHGDVRTAWASATPDGQDEWLLLEYNQPVLPGAILIYETFNPGAVKRVSVFRPDGTEVPVWVNREPFRPPPQSRVLKVPLKINFQTQRVLLHIASKDVPGYNEIDAVSLVDSLQRQHWAAAAAASSSYAAEGPRRADKAPPGMAP